MKPRDIKMLPKWAQEQFEKLECERKAAVSALNKYIDDQTESPIYQDDYISTGEGSGNLGKIKYIQGRRIYIDYSGLKVNIVLAQDEQNIRIYFEGQQNFDAYLEPWASNCINLVGVKRQP